MKNILLVASILVLFACNSQGEKQKTEDNQPQVVKSENKANMECFYFDVEGMTCEGCENAIKKNVSTLPGVDDVSASHKLKNALVVFDPNQTNPDEITKAITSTGYTVKGNHKVKKSKD